MSRREAALKALREYPKAKKRNSPEDQAIIRAVEEALADQKDNDNGAERLRMVELFYFQQTHTMQGAAMECHYSRETIQQWKREILSAVNMALKYENKRPGE